MYISSNLKVETQASFSCNDRSAAQSWSIMRLPWGAPAYKRYYVSEEQ